MIGQSIGNFKILEQLNGTETFGVYKAVDLLLNRNVYIKVPNRELLNKPDIVEGFRFEAATLAKLVHPNIPTLHSLTAADDRLFIITEFLEGETLDKFLRRQGKLSYEKAISIFTQVLDCLEFAHNAGIAHGNLKTDNIFLSETDNVKILGFGMSEGHQIEQTNQDILPEAKSGAGKDIYAVGQMLFEVLTGEKTSSGQIKETEWLLRDADPAIPQKIVQAIINIFRLQTYGKFQSAAELNRELLSVDLNTVDVSKDSADIINTEFLGRAGNNSAAEYSVDFSQDKTKFFDQSRSKAREKNKTPADAPVNWKLAKKNVWVGGTGILAIIALHFFFQFSFINNDAVQMVKELTKTEQVAETEISVETEQVEQVEQFPDTDPFYNQIDDKTGKTAAKDAARAVTKPKKLEAAKKPQIVSPSVQPQRKTAPPPRNVIKKKEPQETRAERLRRAEKILTGA